MAQTSDDIKYTMISAQDRLMLARDALRGRESDHFRLSVASSAIEPTRDSRLPQLAAEVRRLQAVVAELESVEPEAPTTPA